jgi:hypothetical protein
VAGRRRAGVPVDDEYDTLARDRVRRARRRVRELHRGQPSGVSGDGSERVVAADVDGAGAAVVVALRGGEAELPPPHPARGRAKRKSMASLRMLTMVAAAL